jgi:Tol biopolymer transport system component
MNPNLILLIALSLSAFSAQAPQMQETGPAIEPAISADGRWLAFASDRGGSSFLHLWVRPSSGGDARQLTAGLHDDDEPVFSPDGRMLAYRSEVNGGGIYLIPIPSGPPRLFAQAGRRPRFSPDGRRIAYWVATNSRSSLFVGDVSGSQLRPFHAGFHSARDPVWSPDAKYLIFAGSRETSTDSWDWWVSSAEGGEPVATGAARLFRLQHLDGPPSPDLWLSSGNAIIFAATTGENTRLWTLSLSPDPWRVVGTPRRLTSCERDERTPSAGPDGRVLFASRTQNIDIWSLPLNADAAAPKGPLVRLTSDPSIDQRPSLSRDGKRIAWETSRGGNFDVWVKDLVSGNEKSVTSGPLRAHMPALSPDGSRLVYDVHDGEKVTIVESGFQGGEPVRIRQENVGQGTFQWTAKGDEVLYFHREPPGSVGLMNLSSKKRTVLLRHPEFNLSLADARLSPDGRWVAFPVPFAPHRSRLAIARVSRTVIDNERDWTYLMPETMNSFQPEWSPNGRWLYFLSDQTGRLAVWALRLSAEMKPHAAPKPILDFPGVRVTIAEMRPRDIGLAIAKDKLALAVAEYSGTIWSAWP